MEPLVERRYVVESFSHDQIPNDDFKCFLEGNLAIWLGGITSVNLVINLLCPTSFLHARLHNTHQDHFGVCLKWLLSQPHVHENSKSQQLPERTQTSIRDGVGVLGVTGLSDIFEFT